jgi:hypothetical protein
MRPRAATIFKLAIAAAVGLAYPYLELAWKCRSAVATSESCVWGRAYFPLTRWVEPLVVTPIAFLAVMLIDRYVIRRGKADSPPA